VIWSQPWSRLASADLSRLLIFDAATVLVVNTPPC